MKIKNMKSSQLKKLIQEASKELRKKKLKESSRPDDLSTIMTFDNGGKTDDRYTVYFPQSDYHITLSDYPDTPRGAFNKQSGKPRKDEKLGQQIHINQMAHGARERVEKELRAHEHTGLI